MSSGNHLAMPKLGLTMTEGTVVEWKIRPGQPFRKGDVLVVIATEKVEVEVEAESDGWMMDLVVEAGETVPVGAVIANWRCAGDTADGRAGGQRPESEDSNRVPDSPGAPVSPTVPSMPVATSTSTSGRTLATPLARRIASQHGIPLCEVRGTGPSGRIRAADVDAKGAGRAPEQSADSAHKTPAETVDHGVRAPADRVQAVMAKRLSAVKKEVPHFYLSREADVGALIGLHKSLNEVAARNKITINHFVVAAVGRALLDLPNANRVWAGEGEIISYRSTDVGIAVNTPRGLYVPILRNVGPEDLDGVARRASALVKKTHDGHLRPEDLSGGSISVSNAGMHSVTYLTPIINPGHSSILGVGSVRTLFRPDGQGNPALTREIGLVLACDHRIHNGVSGLDLLNRIILYLENPLKLLWHPPK